MKRKSLLLMVCLSLSLFVGGIYAYVSEEISATNHIDTGVVDIELNEYQLNEKGELELWENNPIISPGMKISKIPRIENAGYDCFVRAKLDMSLEDLDNCYYDFGEDWVLAADGYYYYTKVLESDTYVDIFQGIQVPADFPQEHEGKVISLKIDVDSIQSKNFTPDFSAERPWGTVAIQKCIHEGPYNISQVAVAEPNKMGIIYEGSSKKLISNSDDFFENFIALMPGDVFKDALEMKNLGKRDINLYFRTECVPSDLLSKMELVISLDNGTNTEPVYSGPLNSEELEERFLLTKIKAKDVQKLVFSIYMPEELDNAYSLLFDEVKWFFSTEEIIPDQTLESVQTGDENTTALIVASIGLIFSLLCFYFLYKQNKKRSKVNE